MKRIAIPHLNYFINVKTFTKPPEDAPTAKAFVRSIDSHSCDLFLPKGKPHPGDLSHELIHVLQFICLHRNIDFTTETEHMAYLMHYLMGQIMGYKFQ